MKRSPVLSVLLSSILLVTDLSFFFTIFLGVAIRKVMAPRIRDTKTVPIVLDVDILNNRRFFYQKSWAVHRNFNP